MGSDFKKVLRDDDVLSVLVGLETVSLVRRGILEYTIKREYDPRQNRLPIDEDGNFDDSYKTF